MLSPSPSHCHYPCHHCHLHRRNQFQLRALPCNACAAAAAAYVDDWRWHLHRLRSCLLFFLNLLDVVLTVASSSKAQLLQEAPCRIPEIPLSSFLVTVGALMAEVPKGGLSGDRFLSLFGSSPS